MKEALQKINALMYLSESEKLALIRGMLCSGKQRDEGGGVLGSRGA